MGAQVLSKAPFASRIVSPRNSPLSVGLTTGSMSWSWAFRSALMISSCWSYVRHSDSKKPAFCTMLEVSGAKYQLLTRIFFLVVGLPLLISPAHWTFQQVDR